MFCNAVEDTLPHWDLWDPAAESKLEMSSNLPGKHTQQFSPEEGVHSAVWEQKTVGELRHTRN